MPVYWNYISIFLPNVRTDHRFNAFARLNPLRCDPDSICLFLIQREILEHIVQSVEILLCLQPIGSLAYGSWRINTKRKYLSQACVNGVSYNRAKLSELVCFHWMDSGDVRGDLDQKLEGRESVTAWHPFGCADISYDMRNGTNGIRLSALRRWGVIRL